MRTIFFIVLSLLGTTVMGYSQKQDSKVSKQRIERNKNIDTKNGYNYFMLDVIKDVDIVYTEYEELVQRVWDKKVSPDLRNSSVAPLKEIDNIRVEIIEMPIFQGGLKYRNSVLDYIEAVKQKIRLLEKYGILGADANSDVLKYNDAGREFYEADNVATEKRNNVRKEKTAYEKTVYIK